MFGLTPLSEDALILTSRSILFLASLYLALTGGWLWLEVGMSQGFFFSPQLFLALIGVVTLVAMGILAYRQKSSSLLPSGFLEPSVLHGILEGLPLATALVEGKKIRLNLGCEKLFGFSSKYFGSVDKFLDAVCGREAREVRNQIREYFKSPKKSAFVFSATNKKGRGLWVELYIYRQKGTEVWIFHDVTDKIESKKKIDTQQREMENSEKFLTAVIDNLPLGLFCKDYGDIKQPKIIMWNRAAESMWTLRPTEVLYRSDEEIFPKAKAEEFRVADLQALHSQKMVYIPREVVEIPGRFQRVVRTWKIPIKDEHGNPRYLLGISQDITYEATRLGVEVKPGQEAIGQARDSQIEKMVEGVAYELNNPISVIDGYNRLLAKKASQKGGLSEQEIEYFHKKIKNGIAKLLSVSESLTEFSNRRDSGDKSSGSVATIVEDTLRFCQERLLASGIEIRVDSMDPSWTIFGYSAQISQVILSLILNSEYALRNTPKKVISISAERYLEYVDLQISDNGEGISQEVRAQIMTPFFTTKEMGQATGLGLSIAQEIVASHGGQLFLNPESQETCFVIRLPLYQGRVAQDDAPEQKDEQTKKVA